MIVLMVGILITMALLSQQEWYKDINWLSYVLFGVIAILLAISFLVAQLSRKKVKGRQTIYVTNLMNLFGEYLYRGEGYNGYSLDMQELFKKEIIAASQIYSSVSAANSRAVYTVNMGNFSYKVAEAVAEVPSEIQKKKFLAKQPTITAFLGRYFVAPNNLDVSEPIFIYVKGDSKVISYPSEIEKIKLLEAHGKYDVLGTAQDRKLLKKRIFDVISRFNIDDTLYDLTFAFHNGRTYVTLSYSEAALAFPLELPFTDTYLDRERRDELLVKEILAIANE
jgi:hypothetical protein